jgi:hypothetical protein
MLVHAMRKVAREFRGKRRSTREEMLVKESSSNITVAQFLTFGNFEAIGNHMHRVPLSSDSHKVIFMLIKYNQNIYYSFFT